MTTPPTLSKETEAKFDKDLYIFSEEYSSHVEFSYPNGSKSSVNSFVLGKRIKAFIAQVEHDSYERGKREERKLCKQVYVDGCDWMEWGISDEEASEDFDIERDELESLTNTQKGTV